MGLDFQPSSRNFWVQIPDGKRPCLHENIPVGRNRTADYLMTRLQSDALPTELPPAVYIKSVSANRLSTESRAALLPWREASRHWLLGLVVWWKESRVRFPE